MVPQPDVPARDSRQYRQGQRVAARREIIRRTIAPALWGWTSSTMRRHDASDLFARVLLKPPARRRRPCRHECRNPARQGWNAEQRAASWCSLGSRLLPLAGPRRSGRRGAPAEDNARRLKLPLPTVRRRTAPAARPPSAGTTAGSRHPRLRWGPPVIPADLVGARRLPLSTEHQLRGDGGRRPSAWHHLAQRSDDLRPKCSPRCATPATATSCLRQQRPRQP